MSADNGGTWSPSPSGRIQKREASSRPASARRRRFGGSAWASPASANVPVVDGEGMCGAELGADSNGLLGSHVHWPHKPLRLISTDGQQREANGGIAAA